MNTRPEKWAPVVGGLLLGAGLGCLVLLIPLPTWIPLRVLSPEATIPDLVIGGLCLLIGALGLLLPHHGRRPVSSPTLPADPTPEEEETVLAPARPTLAEQDPNGSGEQIPPWLLGTVFAHCSAGREAIAAAILNEWKMSTSSLDQPANTGDLRLLPCRICGLPDLAALLYLCARCHGLAHEHCSTFVHRAQEEGATLSLDPKICPLCQECLEELQQRGFTLISDQCGLLLLRPVDTSDDF